MNETPSVKSKSINSPNNRAVNFMDISLHKTQITNICLLAQNTDRIYSKHQGTLLILKYKNQRQ